MERNKKHWTEKSISDFIFRIGADFVAQIEAQLEAGPVQQKDLAKKLEVSEGAVSQTLNNPGNLKLQTIANYARALELKVSIVLYDDNDPKNEHGPVHADVFKVCWEGAGKPKNFWEISAKPPADTSYTFEGIVKECNGGYTFMNDHSTNICGTAFTFLKSQENMYGRTHSILI